MHFHKGFTLIELLVVIAIIGLLSMIVLVNTQGTRFKAHDSSIQSLMHQVRNGAEFIYTQNGESYDAICDESNNTLSDNDEMGVLERAVRRENDEQNVICFESADKKEFAAASPLRAQPGKYWCVEAAGLSQELDHQITGANCQ